MYQYHRQMTHTHLALHQWLNCLEGPQISQQALQQAKTLLRIHIFRNSALSEPSVRMLDLPISYTVEDQVLE